MVCLWIFYQSLLTRLGSRGCGVQTVQLPIGTAANTPHDMCQSISIDPQGCIGRLYKEHYNRTKHTTNYHAQSRRKGQKKGPNRKTEKLHLLKSIVAHTLRLIVPGSAHFTVHCTPYLYTHTLSLSLTRALPAGQKAFLEKVVQLEDLLEIQHLQEPVSHNHTSSVVCIGTL